MNQNKEKEINIEPISELLGANGITSENVKKIITTLNPLKLKRGHLFSEMGKRTHKLGILIDGLLVAKYESKDSGDEIISRFYYSPRNIIVVSFESFNTGVKSKETIEALEDSYLVIISKDDLSILYDEIPQMNRIGRQLAEQSYCFALERIHQLQALNVSERLNKFYDDHPSLANRLKIQHLCSYIGTNRNALSRLMKKRQK